MKKYLVTYHAPAALLAASMNTSPEESAKGMEAWHAWAKQCGDKLVDLGNPLMGGLQLNPDGTATSSNKQVCGNSLLQAESMDDAKKLLAGHPHLAWDSACNIEVHEAMALPGM